MLNCKEFSNADEIAKGLSPFQPEKVSIEAGRIMLQRINELLKGNADFAFETTLTTKSYVNTIKHAQQKGYEVTLLFLWLNSPELAIERVKSRVREGGHSIAEDVIRRRYFKGISNLFNLFMPIVDNWMLIDNSEDPLKVIAEGNKKNKLEIFYPAIWNKVKAQSNG